MPAFGKYKDIVTFKPTKFISDSNNPVEVIVSLNTNPKSNLDSILKDELSTYKTTKSYKNIHVISSDTQSTLAGQSAYSLLFSTKEYGIPTTILETGTLIGNKVYYIQYYVDSDKYSTYLPVVQNMIKSFKISNPQ